MIQPFPPAPRRYPNTNEAALLRHADHFVDVLVHAHVGSRALLRSTEPYYPDQRAELHYPDQAQVAMRRAQEYQYPTLAA